MIVAARKTLTLLSLACYLMASSVGAVHAIPMAVAMGGDGSEQVSMPADMNDEDCHSPQKPPCEMSGSSSCKIFCSAMGQGIADTIEFRQSEVSPSSVIAMATSLLLTRQLAVDPRPPK